MSNRIHRKGQTTGYPMIIPPSTIGLSCKNVYAYKPFRIPTARECKPEDIVPLRLTRLIE
jgi:hypothetical protein